MKCRPLLLIYLYISILSAFGQDSRANDHQFQFSFTENKNQWEPVVRYRADIPSGLLFLEDGGLTYFFVEKSAYNKLISYKYLPDSLRKTLKNSDLNIPCHAFKVKFVGANKNISFTNKFPLPSYRNYFTGNDRSRWASNVKSYDEIQYNSLYPGIDLQITAFNNDLKYNFIVQPGADPEQIHMEYIGADVKVLKGELKIKTSVNSFKESAPIAWQLQTDGSKKEILCRYVLKNNVISFSFPDGFDAASPIIIDPTLVFSSYSGATQDNWGFTATYDNKGFLYAGGVVFGAGYPIVTGSFQQTYGGGMIDISISKFDTTGSFLVYSTYLGGGDVEIPTSLVADNSNNLFILGSTSSANFPVTQDSYDTSFNGGYYYKLSSSSVSYQQGSDIIISKLSEDGTNLLSSTFFGGSGNDGLNMVAPLINFYADDPRGEIKVDENSFVYIISSTNSTDLPVTPGVFQANPADSQNVCIFKMNGNLKNLVWCSYFGGSGKDAGYGLTIDMAGNIYFVGGTTSSNLPVTTNAIYSTYQGGSCDGFIAKISPDAGSLMASTYYGSNKYDQVYFIDRNKAGAIFVFGQTNASGQYFINNVNYYVPGGGQFLSKLSPDLQSRIWSTALGTGNGGPDIAPTAFLVDLCEHIYFSGWGGTNSCGSTAGLPVTPNAFQTTTDSKDYYFFVLEKDASSILYATFFGGTSSEHVDGGTSRFDKKGKIYQCVCAGCGAISNFPTTPGAWREYNGSWNCNVGVIKFDFNIPLVVASFIQPPTGCAPYTITFQNNSSFTSANSAHYSWNFGGSGSSTLKNPVHTFNNPGVYPVTLIVSDTGSCNLADTLTLNVVVLSDTSYILPAKHICDSNSWVQIGIPPIPDPNITFSWLPVTGLSNPAISNPIANPLQSTAYTMIMSANNCRDTIYQVVTVENLKVNAGIDTVVCTTSIELTATANSDSLMFLWSSEPDFSDTLNSNQNDSTVIVTLLNQVNWFYVMAYNSNCHTIDSVRVSFTILLSQGNNLNPTCPDSCNGSAWVTISGGTPPYEYQWNTGATSPKLENLCKGIYTLTVTDDSNCKSVATIVLEEPSAVEITLDPDHVSCAEVCDGAIYCTLSGGLPPYQYIWSNGASTLNPGNLCAGNYSISVTDSNDCPSNNYTSVLIDNIFINVELTQSKDTIFKGLSVQINVTSNNAWTYQWSPLTGLNDPEIHNPLASPDITTTYFLTITDPSGCVYIDSLRIIITEATCDHPFVFIPNAFTPNADEKNDKLFVYGENISDMQLQIFDRWGELVFESNDQKQGWNGTFRGKECESGVYDYQLDVHCIDGQHSKFKGNITLIR